MFILLISSYISIFWSIFIVSHPDNSLEVNDLFTPIHIVPEWYFLYYYMVLKAIPNKTSGLLLFILLCLVLYILLEVTDIYCHVLLLLKYINNLIMFLVSVILFIILLLGTQLPL